MHKPDYINYDYFATQTNNIYKREYQDYEFVSRIGELPDYYLFRRRKDRKRSISAGMELMVPRKLYKRTIPQADEICPIIEHKIPIIDKTQLEIQQQTATIYKRDKLSDIRQKLNIQDPGFNEQWHLLNLVTPNFDLNVTGVWEQNITGRGVTVGFMDDGIDHENPDLKDNFSLEGSYDFNEHKKLPTPALYDDTHGTRCAGEVGAVRNNVCGVGIAYEAKVAGLRILSGKLTIADEAMAINYAYNTTQVYSCSWGPR